MVLLPLIISLYHQLTRSFTTLTRWEKFSSMSGQLVLSSSMGLTWAHLYSVYPFHTIYPPWFETTPDLTILWPLVAIGLSLKRIYSQKAVRLWWGWLFAWHDETFSYPLLLRSIHLGRPHKLDCIIDISPRDRSQSFKSSSYQTCSHIHV